MKIDKPLGGALIVLAALVIWGFLLGTSTYADCGTRTYCLSYCGDLSTDKYTYEQGETAKFIFSNQGNYDFTLERIYVLNLQSFTGGTSAVETVYEHTFSDPISPGASWSWEWNQKDMSDNQVQNGRFMGVVETRYCGSYRTSFRIVPKPPKKCQSCCNFWASCSHIYYPCCP